MPHQQMGCCGLISQQRVDGVLEKALSIQQRDLVKTVPEEGGMQAC